jgi:2-keto-4-pentenoate hydratase
MSFDIERAAAALLAARTEHRLIEPFAPGPTDVDEAYAVQDAVVRTLGRIGGWKVGAKAPGETPNAAPLLADVIRPSPAAWPSSSLHMIGVEAEIAFRLGRDVEARTEPVPRCETWASVDSVHAAIEIVDTRLANWKHAERLWVLADNQSNGGFVYAADGIAFCDLSLAEAPVRLAIGGRTVIEAKGGNPAGDPRWLFEWLVTHCAQCRGGLRAGSLVTTGSYTGMLFVDPGVCVEAAFEGIGSVQVCFT